MAETTAPQTRAEFGAVVDGMLEYYRTVKLEHVAEHRADPEVDDSPICMLHYAAPGGGVIVAMPGGTVGLDVVVGGLRVSFGEPHFVGLMSDAYFRTMADVAETDPEPTLERGQLQAEYSSGDPAVHECLLVHVKSKLFVGGRREPYRYEDGELVWTRDEFPLVADQEDLTGGWIPDCLAMAYEEPPPGIKSMFDAGPPNNGGLWGPAH